MNSMEITDNKIKAMAEIERILKAVPIKLDNLIYEITKHYAGVSELSIKKRVQLLKNVGNVEEDREGVLSWIGKE